MSKQSYYVRCPALELLCNSLHGPCTKKFGDPWYSWKIRDSRWRLR